jgi:protein-S-isoprenylcysteine O-methyltransferase Ste14
MAGKYADRKGADVWFPPPLLPLFVVLIGAGLGYLWPLGVGVELPAPGRYWVGGILVAGSILTLGLWPVLMFRKSGQSVIPWTETPKIEIRGPYRFTRNPMYLQMVLVCLGFTIILANGWILLMTPVCAWLLYELAIKHEEIYLEATFGESYRDYKKAVRRWI